MKITYDDIVKALAEHYEVPEDCVFEIVGQDSTDQVFTAIAEALTQKLGDNE